MTRVEEADGKQHQALRNAVARCSKQVNELATERRKAEEPPGRPNLVLWRRTWCGYATGRNKQQHGIAVKQTATLRALNQNACYCPATHVKEQQQMAGCADGDANNKYNIRMVSAF